MDSALEFNEACENLRAEIEHEAQSLKSLCDVVKSDKEDLAPERDKPEMIANLMLSYRHLEDAKMRLGKAIQAYEGGISIFDKKAK